MGWPDSGMLWREAAKPAQKQYADVAKAISQFEPVVMMANPEVCLLALSLYRCTGSSPGRLCTFTLALPSLQTLATHCDLKCIWCCTHAASEHFVERLRRD